MSDFTASNGIKLKTLDDGQIEIVYVGPGGGISWTRANEAQALREFFEHERDEELGRWRWPEHPNYVVYPSDQFRAGEEHGWIRVVNERTSFIDEFNRHSAEKSARPEPGFANAARAYFEAHPVKKPWHDAKPGEVWIVTIDGTDRALLVDPGQFTDGNLGYDFTDSGITAARRIWPEETA